MSVRGRLAPSPTGALHLGNARSFLIAWLSARQQGGSIILRMEDLDHPKIKPGAAQEALDDLRWLGLDWDEGPDKGGPHEPYVQSRRADRYCEALQRLVDQGLVYACTCSRKDVEAGQRAPHPGEEGPRYPGACRGRWASYDEAAAALPEGRLPAWRFSAPDREVAFVDSFHGPQKQNVQAVDGDFVIARRPDGAGYQLAVVVDDAAMGVTEVVRGDDLLASTHRQLLLHEALGLTPPRYVHAPLVTGPDGRRLAKRHGDTRIAHIRARRVRPERVVGLLAHWCGWAQWGEELTPGQLLARFRLDLIPKNPIVVDQRVKAYLEIA